MDGRWMEQAMEANEARSDKEEGWWSGETEFPKTQ